MQLAPIILFVYNRPWHTKETILHLQKNYLAKESILHIFSDGPKNKKDKKLVQKVRHYIRELSGFRQVHIIERPTNLGLANSVITGISKIFKNTDNVIVLEDDIITSPHFLKFINTALTIYQKDQRIFSVSGYLYPCKLKGNMSSPVLLYPRASTWGWGTWKDRWLNADWLKKDFSAELTNKETMRQLNRGGNDLSTMLFLQNKGAINSWGIRWCLTHSLHNAYGLFPAVSLIQNIGLDGSGVHCLPTNDYNVTLLSELPYSSFPKNIEVNENIIQSISSFFSN